MIATDTHLSEEPVVKGQKVEKLPDDLYIPPDALRIFLETFQGPLDLLLYLIKRQNLDILEIPIVEITRQYLSYIEMMQSMQMDLAAEYLLMAATLAEIKSRLLLPRPLSNEEGDEPEDPRAELVRRLQEYERFKSAAVSLEEMPRMERDILPVDADAPKLDMSRIPVSVDLGDIFKALSGVLKRAALYTHHRVVAEALSVRDKMTVIIDRVSQDSFINFSDLFTVEEGRLGVVVTLIAILELTRESLLELVQSEPGAEIYVREKPVEATQELIEEEVICES